MLPTLHKIVKNSDPHSKSKQIQFYGKKPPLNLKAFKGTVEQAGGRLKVHKIEIFLALILKFVLFLCQLCQNIKILPQKILIGPILGEVRFSAWSWDYAEWKKFLSQVNFFFSFVNPLYEPILVFPKFDPITAPGMALRVNLGPKCQNLFPLV